MDTCTNGYHEVAFSFIIHKMAATTDMAIQKTFLYQKVAFKAVPLHQQFQLPRMFSVMIVEFCGCFFSLKLVDTLPSPQKNLWL